ncbi:MAG: hypothetical protein ACT4PY_11310 [Armatimonadota bacterium]
MRTPRAIAVALAIMVMTSGLTAGLTVKAYGQDLFSIIKTLGIGYAVRTFAPQINDFINGLLQNRGVAVREMTKVVPILNIGIGINSPGSAYVGAAQVSGPRSAVERVQAVAQLDADYQQAFRIKIMVPVDNLQPWVAFRRVNGVGVSAVIDIRI